MSDKRMENPDSRWIEAQMLTFESALARFVPEMRARFEANARAGKQGWLDPANARRYYHKLISHVAARRNAEGIEPDLANLALILWNLSADKKIDQPTGAGSGDQHA